MAINGLYSQSPDRMSFQAVLRNNGGFLIENAPIGILVNILRDHPDGASIYSEKHAVTTNANGLFTLEIGAGTVLNGAFSSIDWSEGPYFLKTETDPDGGENYILTGVSQLLSVPYALYAKVTDSLQGGIIEKDGSIENEIQELEVSGTGDTLFLSKSNWVIIPGISAINNVGRIVEDVFTSTSLQGNLIGDTAVRNVNVYLPPGYDRGRDFPVVYLLHGLPPGHRSYTDSLIWEQSGLGAQFVRPDFPKNGFKDWMDQMINSGLLEKMIVVTADASCSYLMSWYSNSELNGNYEDFITQDLVTYIDAHYKTRTNANGRAIMGHSMGGYGAIVLGLKRPDIFSVIAAHSPLVSIESFKPFIPLIVLENPMGLQGPDPSKFLTSALYATSAAWSPNLNNPPFFVDLPFTWPNTEVISGVWSRWSEHDPLQLLSTQNVSALKGLYFDGGNQDEFGFPMFYPLFTTALDDLGVNYTYQSFEGTHWNKLYERMVISLKFISDHFTESATSGTLLGSE